MSAIRSRRIRTRFTCGVIGMAVAACFVVAGCKPIPIDKAAPPVGPEIEALGVKNHADHGSLLRGRAIYLNQCIECHHPYRVDAHSMKQYERHIYPEMIHNAKLTREQEIDLRAYVAAAHEAMRTGALKPKPLPKS